MGLRQEGVIFSAPSFPKQSRIMSLIERGIRLSLGPERETKLDVLT
jgi:hypothetical protein